MVSVRKEGTNPRQTGKTHIFGQRAGPNRGMPPNFPPSPPVSIRSQGRALSTIASQPTGSQYTVRPLRENGQVGSPSFRRFAWKPRKFCVLSRANPGETTVFVQQNTRPSMPTRITLTLESYPATSAHGARMLANNESGPFTSRYPLFDCGRTALGRVCQDFMAWLIQGGFGTWPVTLPLAAGRQVPALEEHI